MRTFEINGETLSLTELAHRNGVSRQSMSARVLKATKEARELLRKKKISPDTEEGKKMINDYIAPLLNLGNMQGHRADLNKPLPSNK